MIVTGREFRSRQGKYVGAAFSGQDVVVQSRIGKFRIIPLADAEQPTPKADRLERKLSSALKETSDALSGASQLMSWEEMLDELDN